MQVFQIMFTNHHGRVKQMMFQSNTSDSSSLQISHDEEGILNGSTNLYDSNSMGETLPNTSGIMDTSLTTNTTSDSWNTSDLNESLVPADSYKTIQRFFAEHSRIANNLPVEQVDLNSCRINSILLPYQRETVKWMIMRETKHSLVQLDNINIELPRGGILADEMGLGKTVEVLACIVGHSKPKLFNIKENTNDTSSAAISPTKKRPHPSKPSFLKKKPRLSEIKQNATLKKEIKSLLHEYFTAFSRKVLKKSPDALNSDCLQAIENGFKILLLNRYYNNADIEFAKQQVWAYLISEFDVHRENNLSYSILLKESLKEGKSLPEDCYLNDVDATTIINLVNTFLTDKLISKFQKEFYRKMRFSINISAGEFIPLSEGDDVVCSCGSDKAKGDKIRCFKCQTYQHIKCVGLCAEPEELDDYYCPNCWMNKPAIESAATLIVIPHTLTQQWTDEIKKHAADCNLKVHWYKGVKKHYILPPTLSSYDIVLITSETLGAELPFASKNSRSLRYVKRYQSFITPLTCIRWWRLCIDEAQMVEGINRISEMASRLQTEHLWAVTGTPITNSLYDLYRLCVFLRMEPFLDTHTCWRKLIEGDQSSLHLLFAHLMRRKTKNELNDQLDLPNLTYDTQWLSFSPVEGYFYKETHAASKQVFMQKINNVSNLDQPLKKANRHTVKSLLAPLLQLRQACVTPLSVRSLNLFNTRKNETMQHLLEKMIKKTKIDCDDILRLYVMFINGLARLHIQANKMQDAIVLYRSVLAKTKIYIDLKMDDFQLIHIMHNLYEAAEKDPTVVLTEDEKEFPRKIAEIETKCLDKLQEELLNMNKQLSKYTTEITNYLESFELKQFSWWDQMLNMFNFTDVVNRIHENLERDHIPVNGALKLKLSSVTRLREALKLWLSEVESKRDLTFVFLEQITNVTSREALWTAADNCHMRQSNPKKTCLICRMEMLMLKYEALLFNTGDRSAAKETTSGESNWKHTALECALHVLLTCSRSTLDLSFDNTNAGHQLKALSLLKREFRAVRAIWTKQCDLLHVFDEIRMAKSTLDPNATGELLEAGSVFFEHEIETFQEQSRSAYLRLQTKYGSLQYLKNLQKRYTSNENIEEACPVCHMSMDEKRAVMTCGHFTCYGCMQALMMRSHRQHFACPVCRTSVPLSSVSYVYGGGTSDFDRSDVQGNYSIKILAVTAKVLELTKQDPHVKILVFSAWEGAIYTFEMAFNANKISFQRYRPSGESGKASLASFKIKNDVNVLLIPLKSGSKGLNLTEASHIIFAEPVLNLADEKQAIGRIYRLGQKRPMVIHKFIVKSSIEEYLHKMVEELQQSNGSDCEVTFRHLRDVFEASSTNLTEM